MSGWHCPTNGGLSAWFLSNSESTERSESASVGALRFRRVAPQGGILYEWTGSAFPFIAMCALRLSGRAGAGDFRAGAGGLLAHDFETRSCYLLSQSEELPMSSASFF